MFVQRKIDLTFKLGTGSFGEDGADEVTITGLRVQASISQSGARMGEAQLRIYGLTPSLMNQLSALNQAFTVIRNNTITINAGDDVNGMSMVFQGLISMAQIDLSESPASALNILAYTSMQYALKKAPASSYKGTVRVSDILRDMATKMGIAFEDTWGIDTTLSSPYFDNTLYVQARDAVEHAGIEWNACEGNTLAIWPKGKSRKKDAEVISSKTGMVGYPGYDNQYGGITVTTEFNPRLIIGGPVKVESELMVANGNWYTYDISHDLESETPGGQWFTRFRGAPLYAATQ